MIEKDKIKLYYKDKLFAELTIEQIRTLCAFYDITEHKFVMGDITVVYEKNDEKKIKNI